MHSAHHLNIFLPYCSLAAIALLSAAPCSLAGPLFETHCAYVEATLEQFLSWTRDDAAADVGPFCKYSTSEYWAYADYKYIAMLFQDLPSMFEVIAPPPFRFKCLSPVFLQSVDRKIKQAYSVHFVELFLLKGF